MRASKSLIVVTGLALAAGSAVFLLGTKERRTAGANSSITTGVAAAKVRARVTPTPPSLEIEPK